MAKATPDSQGRSVRLLRVGEQVRHALAEVLIRGDIRDLPIEPGFINVSEVRLSPDLRHATVFVKALAGGDDLALVKALAANAKQLRGEVARRLATKYTPDLRFRPDESFDVGARIEAVLRRPEIARDLTTPDITGPDEETHSE